jgi:hypothetical protein
VGLPEGVEVRTSRSASIGVVTKLMDVHSTLRVGVVTSNVVGDCGWAGLRVLSEGYGSADLGVTADDSNWRVTWWLAL